MQLFVIPCTLLAGLVLVFLSANGFSWRRLGQVNPLASETPDRRPGRPARDWSEAGVAPPVKGLEDDLVVSILNEMVELREQLNELRVQVERLAVQRRPKHATVLKHRPREGAVLQDS